MARISKKSVIMLVKSIGYSPVAKKMGENYNTFKARVSGTLKWTDEYEYRVLKALKELGVLQEISLITKRAVRELKNYEEKFKEQN